MQVEPQEPESRKMELKTLPMKVCGSWTGVSTHASAYDDLLPSVHTT